MTLKLIEVDDIAAGMIIYYKWQHLASPIGPYKVKLVSRDRTGPYAILNNSEGDRRISLADDEDYGPLSVYTE